MQEIIFKKVKFLDGSKHYKEKREKSTETLHMQGKRNCSRSDLEEQKGVWPPAIIQQANS